MNPEDLLYTKEHEWIRITGDTGTIGITDHAQQELGDVVFVELPKIGDNVTGGKPLGTIESVKAVSEVFCPVSGEILEVNTTLVDAPETVNADPYGKGWLVKLRVSAKPDGLLSAKQYEEYTAQSQAMRYIPCSESDRKDMLASMGVGSIEQLFSGIPEVLRLRRLLNIPDALSEPELLAWFQATAAANSATHTSFLGAGVYRHHIPVIVDALISRSEFYTAYTPYQAEIAQGTLQAIFEFQTYMTQLTGMEVANASLYDGSTALTEAMLMAHRITKRNTFLVARTVHPEYRAVMATYAKNLGIELQTVGYTATGRIDLDQLKAALNENVAGVAIQSPNFFGTIEDTAAVAALAQPQGALSIVNVCEALSMGILRPPQEADIVVGEAQSLGVPISFGGPHLGFLATRDKYVRQMPGRIVGMGKDQQRHRAFVLTLSTREQHIRREKATSNICTNQSLCALMATVYLAALGPRGLREAAEQNLRKTDYAVKQIQKDTPHKVLFPASRFNEFVLQLDGQFDSPSSRIQKLAEKNIVPGLALERFYPELANSILVCVTETTTRKQIDALVEGLR